MRDDGGAGAAGRSDFDYAERLAALREGGLRPREREEVLKRLTTDHEALAAFTEAVAVMGALEAEDAAAGVTPLRPATRSTSALSGARRWGAIAAAAAAVALAPLAWNRLRTPGLEEPGALAERLASTGTTLPAGWDPSPWGSTRSASDPLTPRARAVRVGARLVELELGLRARDAAASRTAAQVAILVGELPASAPVVNIFRRIQSLAGAPWAEVEPLVEQGSEAAAALAGEDEVRLGAWLQAARLAAARRDAAFFRTRATDAALDRLQDDPATRPAAERIRAQSILQGAPDWDALGRDLATLLADRGA